MKVFLRCLAFIFIAITQLSAQEGWEWQNPKPQGFDLSGAVTINSETGIVVGYEGTILKTTDGGMTWNYMQIENNSYAEVPFIFMLNSEIFYGIQGETLIKSTNGGEYWQRISDIPHPYAQTVFFIDEKIGWAHCWFSTIFRTTDGGLTWEEGNIWGENSQEWSDWIYSIFFVNENTGWAVGYGYGDICYTLGYIFKTEDGGKNWEVNFVTPDCHSDCSWFDLVYFVNDKIGYARGMEFDNHKDDNYKTVNGGETWFHPSEDPPLPFDEVGWKVEEDNILRTEDGGRNWQTQTKYVTRENLNSVFFLDDDRGYIVGDNGVILSTVDGGEMWYNNIHESLSNFKSVYFTDSENGWILGGLNNEDDSEEGIILKTDDVVIVG